MLTVSSQKKVRLQSGSSALDPQGATLDAGREKFLPRPPPQAQIHEPGMKNDHRQQQETEKHSITPDTGSFLPQLTKSQPLEM